MAAPNKAVVKAVMSGDTVVVMGTPVGGPPPEKQITLAGIISPRLGRRDGSTKDEPFAWPAREWVRNKMIGKSVTFELEETVASIGKSFGHVYIDGQNLSSLIVAAGWAKVKPVMGQNAARVAHFEELSQLEQRAQGDGLGMWSQDPGAAQMSVRNIIMPGEAGYDAKDLLDACRGQTQNLVIEHTRDGNTVRGYLLPSFQWVTVLLSGISCPGFKRAEEPGGADIPEPFALEAKYFVESRLLNREVPVLLEGVDKYNQFCGTLIHPAGNISAELLKVGLAKVIDWSAKFTKDPELLYKSERIAKERRLRIWKDYVAPQRNQTANAEEFVGKVVEVISGDFMVIKDMSVPPQELRIALSSIRAPKLGRRDEKDEPFAYEAREFLRSRLIGRKVTVGIDYMRQLPNSTTESERLFASVLEGQNNVAIALVANGLANVQKHRQDDHDRSLYYDDLIQAEAAASRDKKGLHGDAAPPTRHINDVSTPAATAQAKQMFGFVQRGGKVQGIVQHVVHGARYKVLIPKHSCVIALAIAGIRCPATGRKDGEPGEPYGEEAYQYARDKCLQHDVEIEVTAQDKIGTFIGRLWVHKRDMGVELLGQGYARMTGRDSTSEMESAQAQAQQQRLRTWEKYDAELEAQAAAEAANQEVEDSSSGGETKQVTVTEMVDPITFYVHEGGVDKQLSLIGDRLASMSISSDGAWKPKIGEVCAAKFSADGLWYRARVEGRKGDAYSVTFIDYGNGEDVKTSDLKELPNTVPSPAQVPGQALEYKLAFIKVPKDEESRMEAFDFIQGILGECQGVINVKVEYRERSGRHHVTVVDSTSGENMGGMLLRNGLAKLERRRADMPGLKEEQEKAKTAHLGIWQYGDAVDSDEDDNRMAQDVAAAKSKAKGPK